MKKILVILLLTIVISGYRTYSDGTIIGKYYYARGYSSIELDLTPDGKFLRVSSSCTVDLLWKGTWKITNDTLVLDRLEFSDSKNKIWMPTYNEPDDYFVFKDNKLFYLEKTDSATFNTGLVLEKKAPEETKPAKRKVRKK